MRVLEENVYMKMLWLVKLHSFLGFIERWISIVSHPSSTNTSLLIPSYSYWAKPEHCLDLSQYLNNHVAQCVEENPKRFVGRKIIAKDHLE